MTIAQQQSTTSLTQYAINGPRNSDLYGSISGDFCNSFWGPGDDGVNILFARMRGAAKTTEELKSFWNERFVYTLVPGQFLRNYRFHQSSYRRTVCHAACSAV